MSWNKTVRSKEAVGQGGPGSLSLSGPAAAAAEDTPCSLWQDSLSPRTCSLKIPSQFLALTLCSVGWCCRVNIAHRGFLIWWRRRELILTALCHIEFASCFYCNLHLKINQQQSSDSCSPERPELGIHVKSLVPTNAVTLFPLNKASRSGDDCVCRLPCVAIP